MQNNTFSTLFIARNLIRLSTVDSTNNFLKMMVSKSEPLPEGTVIMADEQYAGRGQQGNSWVSAKGLNLTFSIYLTPAFLAPKNQFFLNIAISLGICTALCEFVDHGIKIKWPNDIYFKDKKIGGVLVENNLLGNQIKTSIVGIGININQKKFGEIQLNNASSLSEILQQDVDLMKVLIRLCQCIEAQYLKLKAGHYVEQTQKYFDFLYQFNESCIYRSGNHVFKGTITGVTEAGQLIVASHEGEQYYNFKEIEFLNKN